MEARRLDIANDIDADDSLAQRIAWLRQVRLFEDIRGIPGALEHVAGAMELKHYARDVAILNEGEEGSDAYFLDSGQIKGLKSLTTGDLFPVAILDAKDHPFFGEAALLQNDKRSATIRTETPCACLILGKQSFDALCAAQPSWALPLALKIGRVILERLHRANNDVVLLYNALMNEVKGWNG